jgi:hypothetical protein
MALSHKEKQGIPDLEKIKQIAKQTGNEELAADVKKRMKNHKEVTKNGKA